MTSVNLARVSRVSVTPIPLCKMLCSIRSAPSSSSTTPVLTFMMTFPKKKAAPALKGKKKSIDRRRT